MGFFDNPITSHLHEKRKNLAAAAGVNRLDDFRYLDMIDRYSQKFCLDPNNVFKNTTFDDIAIFLIKWSEESQYSDRYTELERSINTPPPTHG